MSKRNALTEQSIVVDDVLSKLTGRSRGSMLSFIEVTRSVHEYIKNNGLRQRFCPHCNAPLNSTGIPRTEQATLPPT